MTALSVIANCRLGKEKRKNITDLRLDNLYCIILCVQFLRPWKQGKVVDAHNTWTTFFILAGTDSSNILDLCSVFCLHLRLPPCMKENQEIIYFILEFAGHHHFHIVSTE